MDFATIKSKLYGALDILPPSILGDLINNALEDIYNSNDWGFLTKKDIIRTPAMISGSGAVVEYSKFIQLDAVASAAVMAINIEDVPLPGRQIKVLSETQITGAPFLYDIVDYSAANPAAIILEIKPIFLGLTNASAQIQIVKAYYNPPPVIVGTNFYNDFKFWKFFIDLQQNRRLWINTTLDELNNFDPTRNYPDDPRHVVTHPPDEDVDFPKFELYPTPRNKRVYQVIFQRKGLKLEREDDLLPASLPVELVLTRARYKMYEWALANSHKYPELARSSGRFQNLMALIMNPRDETGYPALLQKAIRNDESNHPKAFLGDYMRLPYIDSIFETMYEFGGTFPEFPYSTAIINF